MQRHIIAFTLVRVSRWTSQDVDTESMHTDQSHEPPNYQPYIIYMTNDIKMGQLTLISVLLLELLS